MLTVYWVTYSHVCFLEKRHSILCKRTLCHRWETGCWSFWPHEAAVFNIYTNSPCPNVHRKVLWIHNNWPRTLLWMTDLSLNNVCEVKMLNVPCAQDISQHVFIYISFLYTQLLTMCTGCWTLLLHFQLSCLILYCIAFCLLFVCLCFMLAWIFCDFGDE